MVLAGQGRLPDPPAGLAHHPFDHILHQSTDRNRPVSGVAMTVPACRRACLDRGDAPIPNVSRQNLSCATGRR
ncbi:hypothetical protein Asru_0829_02 [Acidisphaera rubrifaciens HS-AP3]|uniref:Uncharacterized protein n=1 Tax=Acidisphaera rubrifaciens HS-AP3 TaxID=1231350 RepID=A0A0D6P9S5_9PROT|nr:hypothetical protein Asru_0829_02 [Acidisphaera rubrifaciens HS-AP3]